MMRLGIRKPTFTQIEANSPLTVLSTKEIVFYVPSTLLPISELA